jgi:hypothetical protein
MSKKRLYYSDVAHKCGHTVRYEFSLPKDANKQQRLAKIADLERLAEYDCNACEEQKSRSQEVQQ